MKMPWMSLAANLRVFEESVQIAAFLGGIESGCRDTFCAAVRRSGQHSWQLIVQHPVSHAIKSLSHFTKRLPFS